MARAKWYELTPARKRLLQAAAAAAVIAGFMLATQYNRLKPVGDAIQSREDDAGRARARP